MSLELEREILANLILEPARLESNSDLSEELFTSTNRKLFREISRIFEEYRPQSIDEGVLAELSETTRAEMLEFMKGAMLISPGNFNLKVLHLKREGLIRNLYGTVNAECQQQLKTGLWTPDVFDKACNLMAKIRGLDCGDPNQSFNALGGIEAKHIKWLWRGRIPVGMLTILAGDPGLGKSFLCTWLAARLSRGEALPDNAELKEAASTVILSAEDSPSHALRPRAEANGADLSRIFCMEDSAFDIAADIRRLDAKTAADPSIKLIVVDPLNSYLGQVDNYKDPAVRAALRPLTEFAEARQIALLAVMHLNKKADLDGIYRIGGSIGFAGLARSILAVTKDGDDEERRLLLPLKMNYARKPGPLAFWIHDDLRLSFDTSLVDADVEEALSPMKRQAGAEKSQAARWLREFLADGPQDQRHIIKVGDSEGYSRSALFRARASLPIKSHASGFGERRSSSWELIEKE